MKIEAKNYILKKPIIYLRAQKKVLGGPDTFIS